MSCCLAELEDSRRALRELQGVGAELDESSWVLVWLKRISQELLEFFESSLGVPCFFFVWRIKTQIESYEYCVNAQSGAVI